MYTINDKEFKTLSVFIKQNYGIMLKDEKKSLVESRLADVLRRGNFDDFTSYISHVLEDKSGEAIELLINKITTNYTYFLRESEHFTFFKNTVLPFFERTIAQKDLRIWSAGCSSGEEAFTLAMIINDFFGKEKYFWNTKVLATDISTRVLENALQGTYSAEALEAVPNFWKLNYFKAIGEDQFEINSQIKQEVIFRKFNFMNEVFPFKKKFHVIFCRNVMIYFDTLTKDNLVEKFYEVTEPGGYLFIGHSESLNRDRTKYTYIMPSVYRKEI